MADSTAPMHQNQVRASLRQIDLLRSKNQARRKRRVFYVKGGEFDRGTGGLISIAMGGGFAIGICGWFGEF